MVVSSEVVNSVYGPPLAATASLPITLFATEAGLISNFAAALLLLIFVIDGFNRLHRSQLFNIMARHG